ncbi:MAG: ABC transporter permease [Peptostreptococcaceae bacterium]|nr:ABC transporter permease [Peptostreptococcaceae bacterium]
MIRIAARSEVSKNRNIFTRITAIIMALMLSALFIVFLGHDPIKVYLSMLEGSFGSVYRFKETIISTIPLTITSLGILMAFKMKFWNIGAEGQMIMGAFFASYFALSYPDMNRLALLIVMLIAGAIGGGLWALIPAYFKAKYGTNEVLFTLMMNYVALKWITYLQYGPWKDKNALGFPKIPNFTSNAVLPEFLGIHIGWVIALVLTAVVYVFIHYTKKGYEINVIGESENTGAYAGMNVRSIILEAMFIGGALAGIAGMIQASAVSGTLSVEVTGGVGYTAIIVTWLSGLSAPLIVVVSFLFAILIQGGSYIQTAFQIPQSAAQILQGMILLFVLGSEFFVKYQIIFKNNRVKKEGM